MINKINRLREERIKERSGEEVGGASDLPLDHRLSFNPTKDERWSFEGDHVLFNGDDVNELINEFSNDIHCLNNLSASLDQYRQYVWMRGGKSMGKYNGTVNALLEKILGRLGNIYDGLVGGVKFEFSKGDFWVNNINVRAVLSLYRLRPTRKARCYLVGLRNKLALILCSQNGSPHYHGISAEAERLFNEISCALDQIPTDDDYLSLPSAGAC